MWKYFIRFLIAFIIITIVSTILLIQSYVNRVYVTTSNAKNESINKLSIDFYPYIGLLIEFRATDRIISVVQNINYHIPSTWPIQIFHAPQNERFIRNSTLSPLISSGKIILTSLNITFDRNRATALLTDKNFWKQVRGDKVLFFQIDTIMCTNSPHKITDYIQYDYIGAPWDPSWFTFDKKFLVGNGGFSIRSRSKILALLESIPYNPSIPEDVWYSQNLHRVNGIVAPIDVAKTFAVESVFYERPVGIHRFPASCDFRKKLAETCPESAMVLLNAGCR